MEVATEREEDLPNPRKYCSVTIKMCKRQELIAYHYFMTYIVCSLKLVYLALSKTIAADFFLIRFESSLCFFIQSLFLTV